MPTSAAQSKAASMRIVMVAKMKMVNAAMAVMPDASPSRPSIRLMMLVKATR